MRVPEPSIPHPSNLTRGYTIALISAAILSTTAILIRYLTQTYSIPPLVLAFWRDLFVALTLLPFLVFLHASLLRVTRGQLLYLAAYGLLLAIFNSLWTLSVALNGAAVATVLAYCSTAFTALLGRWLFKERLDWAKMLAVAASLGGCLLVSGALNLSTWNANLVGLLTGAFSGLAYAIYTLMGRSASHRGLNPWLTVFYTFGFASTFLFVFNLIPGDFIPGAATRLSDFFWLGNSLPGWSILVLLAAGPTVVGFGLFNLSLVYLPSSVVNLIVTTEPVFTALVAFFVLGERLSAIQIAGGVLILTGVIFLRISENRRLIPPSDDLQPPI